MSRYQWPSPGKNKDRATQRMLYNALTDGVLLADAVFENRRLITPLGAPSDRAAPGGDENLWVPIGPSSVVNGQAGSRPRVAGRVRDLRISNDGQRVYAATANGGVWYSGDGGGTWSPLGNWLPTPTGVPINRAAQALTCGCLLVEFGAAADGSGDDVYVGTGELIPGSHAMPVNKLGGVGVLHLDTPLPAALATPFATHWKREAQNLTGAGIYRLARDPGDPNTLVAATSKGLFKRSGAFVENADWTRVTTSPFDFGSTDGKWTTDVVWASTTPSRLWVALMAGSDTGVYTSTNGLAGPFQNVNLPDRLPNGRLGITVAPSDQNVVYVLGTGPRLWRIVGVTPTRVGDLYEKLFHSSTDQSAYDLALAVHPDNSAVIAMGGAAVFADSDWSASLFKCTVSVQGSGLTAGFVAANQDDPARDATFIGNGVHADVHQIRFVKVGGAVHMWVACDGGVFRSRHEGRAHSFVAANSGLAVLQPGYVMSHPENDAFVITGTQDNGALMRVGDSLWRFSDNIGGDAGCVLFHPVRKTFFVAQYNSATWKSNGNLTPPVMRPISNPNPEARKRSRKSQIKESENSLFYSTGDIRKVGATNQVRLVIGTNRVWLADDWNPAAATTAWVTLPSGNDPRDPAGPSGGNNVKLDVYGKGTGSIVACRWLDDDRLLVMMRSYMRDGQDSVILMLKRRPAGTWERFKEISKHVNKCSDYVNGDIERPTSNHLPPLGAWSDLAVHDPTRGPNGSFYVACTGHVKPQGETVIESDRMDTLWWYDGTSKFYPTGLRTTGTKAPAYAVVCDPGDPTMVYVGTGLGVWRGVVGFAAGIPTWTWEAFSNGLPEATIDDLSLYQGSVKLLRAAVHARGVWEVDLSLAPTPLRRTFLRVHANDARRAETTSLVNPMLSFPSEWPWHASPDVRIRPAPLSGSETPPPPPSTLNPPLFWNGSAPDPFQLWIFQAALHKTDPLCRPTGLWTTQFADRLVVNIVERSDWTAVVTAANVFSPPWDGTEPTEADLFELVVEDGQDPDPTHGPPAISRVKRRKYKVDVLVHYRDLRPLAFGDVKVTLLRRELPRDQALWPTLAIAAAWKTRVEQLMSGGSTTLTDGWTVADTATPTRRPSADLDARVPRAVTFDVNFSGAPLLRRFVLLAVVHSVPDPVSTASLVGNNLKDLICKSHQVAARVVEIKR